MNTLAKSAFCMLYKYSGAMSAQECLSHLRGRWSIPVLLFHRVTDVISQDGLTVSTRWFRDLCAMLKRRFHVVSLGEVLDILESGAVPPRRTLAITFDDCYRDNLDAARALAEFQLPACFFIPTAFPGTDHVFEWDRGLKPMPNLTWDDVREMAHLGHDIGSHSITHPNLAQLTEAEVRRELAGSKKTLEERLGKPVHWFAYPFGTKDNFKPEYLPLVHEAGYRACFSGYGGFVHPGSKGQILPRDPIPYFRSLLKLELHLAGCLDWVYSLKRKVGLICT